MSHQGRVHDPGQSPGLIRVITAGYAVNKDNELIFSTPPHELGSQEGTLSRFVVFLNTTDRKLKYGTAVKFTLEKMEKWKIILDNSWPGWKDRLVQSIPDKRIDEFHGKNFDFEYFATEVEELPEHFILNPFYRFIEDLDKNSSEDVIEKLKDIPKFIFREPFKVNLKGGNRSISAVHVVDYDTFVNKYGDVLEPVVGSSFEIDFLTKAHVDDEIKNKGHHKMSTKEEVPTRRRR